MSAVATQSGAAANLVQGAKVVYPDAAAVMAAVQAGDLDATTALEIVGEMHAAAQRALATKAAASGGPGKKTLNALTTAEFLLHATPLMANIGDTQYVLAARENSTGSYGWRATGACRQVVMVNGVPVTCMVQVSLTAVNTKREVPAKS